jgi:hypothetical protein
VAILAAELAFPRARNIQNPPASAIPSNMATTVNGVRK